MTLATVNDILGAQTLLCQYASGGTPAFPNPGTVPFLGEPQHASGAPLIPSSGMTRTPTTGSGATCDRSTTGAIPLPPDPGSSRYFRILAARIRSDRSVTDGILMLWDRLVEVGGIASNSASEQVIDTVALPSRASGGAGVFAALEILDQTSGGTTPTATINYTNQAGTTGRSAASPSSAIGSSWSTPNTNTRLILPLQAGDTGIRAIHSVTFSSAASTAINVALSLFKPICWLPFVTGNVSSDWLACGFPKVDPQACLEAGWQLVTGISGSWHLSLDLAVDG